MSLDNMFKYQILLSFLICVGVIAALLLLFSLYASGKEDNAHDHAQKLDLKNYKVHCDETPWACGCTITWEVEYGQRTEKFACCGWGCE